MASHCRVMLIEVTKRLSSGELDEQMLETPVSDEHALVEVLTSYLEPEQRNLAMTEFDELPGSFVPALALAWRDAHDAKLPFTVESQPPPSNLQFARTGRVSWTVEMDEAGVRMAVSHIANFHADWMTKPRPALEHV